MYCYFNYICVEHFFGAGVLGLSVWKLSPKILKGHTGATKTDLPALLLVTILEVGMLTQLCTPSV
jgi:hypothetical protein